jgi:flavin reductase (DIM6/NTAB) family NADH-FMN oxidoreductase RutF
MESSGSLRLSAIDQVFKIVDREVWILTAATDDGRRGGLVATWVSQASIEVEYPMIAVGLAPNHYTTELVEVSRVFAAHLITADQLELVWRFGLTSGRDTDKLAGLSLRQDASGAWILNDCLAWLTCRVVGRYDGGDRIYYFAEVLDGARNGDGAPLRQSDLIAKASQQQRQVMQAGQLADVTVLRPLREAWKKVNRIRQASDLASNKRPLANE